MALPRTWRCRVPSQSCPLPPASVSHPFHAYERALRTLADAVTFGPALPVPAPPAPPASA